ncbi:hypothetical protein CRUP_020232 [Coryphaenoides rupestris]|nr:hypothetical protein CRUP_020232 [Coryphaenoides rupestris]
MRMRIPDRRHSTDGSCSAPGSGQFSEGSAPALGDPQHCSPYYSCFQDLDSPGAFTATHGSSSETQLYWDQYSGSSRQDDRFMGTQSTYAALPATPVEPPFYLSPSQGSYGASGPQQDGLSHSLFPKPIYSYSILIFMALKNSKTGSLPVSEIYNFMTENFPYFKTAPDGWKNSVRHNLSLNKCFEKVENKNGNSSRKGCLWALNPAKVDKMHEELHKWQDLDRLLGDKPEKTTLLSAYHRPPSLTKHSPVHDGTTMSLHTCVLREPCVPAPCPHYLPSPAQQYGYPASHPSDPHPAATRFPLYSPCRQQPFSAGLASARGGLSSGKIPPLYHASAAVHTDYAIVPRSTQDMHGEGDASYEVDTLNPSLTDLQLHGNLWEELRDDSMVPDPLANITTAFTLPLDHIQSHGIQAMASVNQSSQDIVIGLGKEEAGVAE